jgi:BolA protein
MTLHEARKLWIEEKLQALTPSTLIIIDESHLHLGHEGAKSGASHFSVIIVSSTFKGLSPVQRHQLVYVQLAEYIPHEIHALKIKACTSEEYDNS